MAIVDFDIHHGNGTEACVRNMRPTEVREEWPCGAGTISLQSTSFKPWLSEDDSDKVVFGPTPAPHTPHPHPSPTRTPPHPSPFAPRR